MSESITVPPDLFKGLKFCLIDDGDNVDKIKNMLVSGGGTHYSYLSDMVTHVVCDNPDNEAVSEAQELFEKPVMTSRWVILSSKCNKLLPLTGFSAIKNQLFYGLVFCPSLINLEDKKKLWAMTTFFGGKFQLNFNKSCTHLVVGKPEGAKYEKALSSGIKVVTPDWIVESIQNKYLCEEDLYHPKLLILPQPKVLHVPSPESTSLTSALISLDKINIDASIAAPSQNDPAFLQNIRLSGLDNKLADDILGNLPPVHAIKTEPNAVQYSTDQQFPGNRMALPQQQMAGVTRPLVSPSSQALYQQQQQQLQHQQMLQQGEQKLNQALQQIQQAQQQPNLQQQRPQLQPGQAQVPQQKSHFPPLHQRMTLAQQHQIQHHILQMQRLRNLQQQQQLRSRPNLPPAQLAQLQQLQQQQQSLVQQQQQLQQQLQQQQQQQNFQQQQPNSQAHLQRQPSPSAMLQKQVHINVQQVPHQQGMAPQGQQALMQPQVQQLSGQNPQAQMQLQLQAQLRQQQQQQQTQPGGLSQLQLQQQALQKHQLQQQLQQQLLKQQHLQHLQQQQQQQTQINQQRAVTQSPNMPPSPLHIQQQQPNMLQPSPRQSPLQQSPLQHSLQHSPQQAQQQPGVQIQHQQPSLPGQRPQTPHQQPSPQQPHHSQMSVPMSPMQQAQQIALEKAAQQSAVEKQQTELIKVQLKQAALERAQAIEKARLQQTLEKVQMQQAALEKAQLQSGIENPHLQQNLLQHAQLQRSASHQLQIQQQLHQLQLQKAGLHQAIQQSQQGAAKVEGVSSAPSPQAQFAMQQGQLQPGSKPSQIQGSAQQIQQQQQNAAQRLQLQQIQQRLQLQQSSQRLQLQGPQAQQLQQVSNIHPLQAQLQLQQGAAMQHLPLAGNSGQSIQHTPVQSIQHTPIQSIQHTPVQSIQHTPAQSIQHTPVQSIQHTPVQSIQHSPAQSLPQGSPAQLQQLRMQQNSPAQQIQLQQGSPAQGSPAQLAQGSPAHPSVQLQGSPSMQLPQGSPAQHLQLSQGSPAPHSQVQQPTQESSPSVQQQAGQVPSQQASQQSQMQIQSPAQLQQMSPQTPQQGQMHQSSQMQQVISQQETLTQATMQTVQSPLDGHSQSPVQATALQQQTVKQMPAKQPQLSQPSQQIPSPLNQIPNQSPLQLPQTSQSQEIQQLQLQMSQQQGHQVQSGLEVNQSAQNPIRQPSPSQMQFHPTQAQLQKLQLQRVQQSQLQQASTQQILLKQVTSQSQMQQGVVQSGNQQIQLPQASVQQVHLHVLQQARLQALRQQQAQLQQSITQVTGSSAPTSQTSSVQVSSIPQGQLLQESQLQHVPGQVVRQSLQGLPGQNTQAPRMQSPLQQAQLQQLAQLQQAQLQQKSQTVLQQNQLQTQLQQIQLRHTAMQQARLQQPGAPPQQLLAQGHIARPQQPSQAQVVTKQIQLQQQSPHIAPPQTPPSPQMQQQARFPHQLSPGVRAVQKQFPANALPANQQPPMHGQPPVQNIHQQQLLQQRQQQLQQQLALQQQLRQRQLQQQQQQQQQQLQNSPHVPQQGVQQIITQQGVQQQQQPVMMKPPPQYPYDRQQLQGQPRIQYPAQLRQLSSGQQSPRGPWPPGQQAQFLRRSPGVNPPPSPGWQHVQQPSPKEELNPSPQPSPGWSQRQVSSDGRDTSTPAQQWTPSQSPTQRDQPPPQSLQWQQLKQLELRRQQLLQQQQQQRPGSQSSQFSPQADQTSPRLPGQALAVPAQYQPQNAPSILSPGAVPGQPPTQVTPKTKTALANLLNTRLQTTGRSADELNQVPMRSPQLVTSPAQASSRRPSADGILQPQNQISERALLPLIPQVIFHGHDNKLYIPPDLCLLGCVFCVQDYEQSSTNNLEMWTKIIVKHGGEVEESYSSKCTHVICENQKNSVVQQALREGKRCVTAYWLNDVLEKKKLKFPWLSHHLPVPFTDDKPCKNQLISVTNFEPEERTILKNIITVLGAKYTGYLTSHNTVVICKKLEGRKVKKAKEWRIPVVNVQWLHDLMFGHYEAIRLSLAHKYQQYDMDNPFAMDYALVPHLMAAWKVPVKISEELIKKHGIELKTPENSANLEKNLKKRESDENLESEAKRFRSESPPLEENIPLTTQTPPDNENRPRVLFTGISKIKDLAKVVCQLGGMLATSEKEVTHLVANEYARTVKFLCAIHSAKFVLTVEWVVECERQNKFVDEMQYILHDTENEKLFGFDMERILNKPQRNPLFQDYVFYVTPGVFPKPEILKRVIEAGGGMAVLKRGPSLKQIKSLEQKGHKFAIITGEDDLHLCKMYMEKEICVQNVEFILTNSIRQELDFTSFAYAL